MNMQVVTSGFVVLIVSIVTLVIVYDLSRWGNRRASRLSSRVTQVKTMDFLVYLTEALSEGQATALLDELMNYYTNFRVPEGERGVDTVSAVLNRLEPIKGELRSLLIRAREIDKARVLAERVKSDFRVALSLSWLFTSIGALIATWSIVGQHSEVFLVILGAAILNFGLTLSFLYKAMKNINLMTREASSKSGAEDADFLTAS